MRLARKVEEKNRMLGKGDGPSKRMGPITHRPALSNRWTGQTGPTDAEPRRGNGPQGTVSGVASRNDGGTTSGASIQAPENSGATRNRRNSSFRHLTDAEIEDRRRRKLCFRCDEPFVTGHVCQNKHLNILILGEGGEHEEEEERREEERVEETAMQLNMGSVAGMTSRKSLKLWGTIRDRDVTVLIDTGATHNFLSSQVVEELGLETDDSHDFVVKVGDGHNVRRSGVCRGVELKLPNLIVKQDFYVFELGGVDVVLGYEWLEGLGKIKADFKEHVL